MYPAFLVILLITSPFSSWGHGGEDHSKEKKMGIVKVEKSFKAKTVYKKINDDYKAKIKPIFQRSCFDCHGSATTFPWYYKIPGVKQYIDYDIKEAKSHLDFSEDFPFKSHESPLRDLTAIGDSVEKGRMPPTRYSVLHQKSKLTESDKEEIKRWIKQSRELINENSN